MDAPGQDRALTLHTTNMMGLAMHLYKQMDFVRMPELDFYAAEDVVTKGYRPNLNDMAS